MDVIIGTAEPPIYQILGRLISVWAWWWDAPVSFASAA
jgi:hypothetical protein